MNLPIVTHCGASLDHVPSSWQVSVPLPIRIWVVTHSMVVVVPGGETVQFPCVDPSTVKAGHSTGMKESEFIIIGDSVLRAWVHVVVHYMNQCKHPRFNIMHALSSEYPKTD